LLYQSVHHTLEQLQAGFDRIEPYKNQDSVLLVCPPDFAQGWLTPRLAQIRRLRPAVEVWLITSREILEIDRIDVDLIISRRPIHTADVECIPLMEDAAIAVCGREAAARLGRLSYPAVLERAPLLFLESEPDWGGLLRDTRLRGRKLLRAATVDDAPVLLDAAARGLGIAYVSRTVAQAALHEGRVVALEAVPSLSRPRYWLMRSRLNPRTPVADFTFNWLQEMAGGRAGKARPAA
jgi:LysR family glycine cleavage system transcriptional activator